LHIGVIIVGKLLLMPLVGLGISLVFYSAGLIGKVTCLMVMIMYAAPTSKQLIMVCKDDQVLMNNISKVFLVMYLIAIVPITVWTIVFIVVLYG
jgi:predicted permease